MWFQKIRLPQNRLFNDPCSPLQVVLLVGHLFSLSLADFWLADEKSSACRLLSGEFRQVCDKIGACRAISDSARSQNVLSGVIG